MQPVYNPNTAPFNVNTASYQRTFISSSQAASIHSLTPALLLYSQCCLVKLSLFDKSNFHLS